MNIIMLKKSFEVLEYINKYLSGPDDGRWINHLIVPINEKRVDIYLYDVIFEGGATEKSVKAEFSWNDSLRDYVTYKCDHEIKDEWFKSKIKDYGLKYNMSIILT